jgi:predicted nucleic acid-binding protein
MHAYLDTSALVKRYVEEEGTPVIDRLYEETEAGRATTSFSIWNIGEALGVFDRYHTRAVLTEEELQTTLRNITSETTKMIRLGSLQVLPITSTNLVEAWALVLRRHIYEADALQVSTARGAGCDVLFGADRHLIQVARDEGINAIDIAREPEEALSRISG